MNSSKYSLLVLLLLCVFLAWMYCPFYENLYLDPEVFRYIGWAMHKGKVPYRDIFDHKPPLIYFFNYTGLFLGPWGLWLINVALSIAATFKLFWLGRRYKTPFPWLAPLLFILMIRCFQGNGNTMNMTREFTSFFLVLVFCVILGGGRYRYFWTGLLTALVFFMQQEQVLLLLPLLVYSLVGREDTAITDRTDVMEPPARWAGQKELSMRILKMGIGFSVIALPLLLYFALFSSLEVFIEDAFLFNFSWYIKKRSPLFEHLLNIRHMLNNTGYGLVFLVTLTLGLLALFFRNPRKGLLAATLATVILTLSTEWLHHDAQNLALSASLPLLLFVVFTFTEEPVSQTRKAQLPWSLILCWGFGYLALQHATHLKRRDENMLLHTAAWTYLKTHPPGDYNLFVFANSDYMFAYYELKVLAPSRWVFQHFWQWYDTWDAGHHELESIAADLLRHRTTYILTNPNELVQFRNPANYKWWMDFLQQYYEQVPLPGKNELELWKRKAAP